MIWGILVFSLITAVILLIPFGRKLDWHTNYRQRLNIALYQQHTVNADQTLTNEMAQRLLQDTEIAQQRFQSVVKSHQNFAYTFILIMLIGVFSYYFSLGRFSNAQQGLIKTEIQQQKFAQESAEQRNDEQILAIQDKLRQNPNDGENWFTLGQAYMRNNEFEHALISYSHSAGLLGERPDILTAAASAMYYQSGQRFTPQVQQLIQKALTLEPKNTAGLSLLASDAFLHNNYNKALQIWQQILDTGYPEVNRTQIIRSMKMAEQLQQTQQKQ